MSHVLHVFAAVGGVALFVSLFTLLLCLADNATRKQA